MRRARRRPRPVPDYPASGDGEPLHWDPRPRRARAPAARRGIRDGTDDAEGFRPARGGQELWQTRFGGSPRCASRAQRRAPEDALKLTALPARAARPTRGGTTFTPRAPRARSVAGATTLASIFCTSVLPRRIGASAAALFTGSARTATHPPARDRRLRRRLPGGALATDWSVQALVLAPRSVPASSALTSTAAMSSASEVGVWGRGDDGASSTPLAQIFPAPGGRRVPRGALFHRLVSESLRAPTRRAACFGERSTTAFGTTDRPDGRGVLQREGLPLNSRDVGPVGVASRAVASAAAFLNWVGHVAGFSAAGRCSRRAARYSVRLTAARRERRRMGGRGWRSVLRLGFLRNAA